MGVQVMVAALANGTSGSRLSKVRRVCVIRHVSPLRFKPQYDCYLEYGLATPRA